MTKTVLYCYLGTNGTILSPVHLEGVYSVKKYELKADFGKILTNGQFKAYKYIVAEDELNDWKEIDD